MTDTHRNISKGTLAGLFSTTAAAVFGYAGYWACAYPPEKASILTPELTIVGGYALMGFSTIAYVLYAGSKIYSEEDVSYKTGFAVGALSTLFLSVAGGVLYEKSYGSAVERISQAPTGAALRLFAKDRRVIALIPPTKHLGISTPAA